MSRRPPNPAAERAAKNQQTIKSLLKLEPNKICADCKKNKHPRWASWNLGVFVCIRCSGIHRGMGTHISRVKSVDLDSWTDEQLQSILSWGNARANKYWEAKLAQGHVPSEAKIENFIRTKYELKRWVMDGGIPDPATLDVDGDDDVPLSLVKEKQQIERKESIRKASLGQSSAPKNIAAPEADLIGGDPIPRASTAGPPASQVPPKASPAPPKTTNAAGKESSLLGLDFFGETPAAPPRPASTTGTGGVGSQSRPDLKQSILSLYASAPRPQPQSQPSHASQGSIGGFGGFQSPGPTSPSFGHQSQKSTGGGLNDAFAGLSFGNVSSPKSPQSSAFSGLGGASSNRSTPVPAPQSTTSAFSNLGGGGFFDSKPAQPQHQAKPSTSSNGFGGFASPSAPAKPAAAPASAALGDLFDFSTPASPPTAQAPSQPAVTQPAADSVFNLSTQTKAPAPPTSAANTASSVNTSGWGGSDVWGNAWSNPDPVAAPAAATQSPSLNKTSTAGSASNDFGGWGSTGGTSSFASQSIVPGASGGFTANNNPLAPSKPSVTADEEFGGWASSTGPSANSGAKPASGFGGSDDLFSNVWQ